MNIEDIGNGLRHLAEEHWKAKGQPILLSNLPKKIEELIKADYKEILGQVSLKNYIKESGLRNNYRLVEHPTQKAKLGIVPADVVFEFADTPTSSSFIQAEVSKSDIDGFVRVLRSLTPDELRQVSLPANLVVRLLDSK